MEHYEGAEKRFELTLEPGSRSLRALGRAAWDSVAAAAGAKVLSRLSLKGCDARLLSESSLFVWDERVVMSTCGRTTLADAVARMLRLVPRKSVRSFLYERRRERFPDRQPSSFAADARTLRRLLPGRAYRFEGLSVYHHGRRAPRTPPTVEALMRGVRPAPGLSKALLGLFPGFRADEHHFRPSGYSLNAVSGRRYCAVHLTPDGADSYASFETDALEDERGLERALSRLLRLFRPRSFDLMLTQQGSALRLLGGRPCVRRLPCGRTMTLRRYGGTAGRRPAGPSR